jgi:hypothetical protein
MLDISSSIPIVPIASFISVSLFAMTGESSVDSKISNLFNGVNRLTRKLIYGLLALPYNAAFAKDQ